MSTSPQVSASDKYLNRIREEGRWNSRCGHRAGVKFSPTLPVNKFTPDEQVAWAWDEAQKDEEPREERPIHTGGNFWYCGSPATEAREFFKMLQRGVADLQTLRGDIGISPEQMEDLNKWIASKPKLESRIRRTMAYRQRALVAFDKLVENDAALSRLQTAAAD